jgi:hypothetical protein
MLRANFSLPSIAVREVGEWDVHFGGAAPLDARQPFYSRDVDFGRSMYGAR